MQKLKTHTSFDERRAKKTLVNLRINEVIVQFMGVFMMDSRSEFRGSVVRSHLVLFTNSRRRLNFLCYFNLFLFKVFVYIW